MIRRRKRTALASLAGAAALFAAVGATASQQVVQTPLPGASIPKYVDPMPQLGQSRVSTRLVQVKMEEFQQKVLPASLYPAGGPFAAGTYVWGYNVNGAGPTYPARTIVAQRGNSTTVNYINEIVGPFGGAPVLQKYLTVDQTIHWADPAGLMCLSRPVTCTPLSADPCCKPYGYPDWPGAPVPFPALPNEGAPVPAVVHLHGGETPPAFDGTPDQWFTPAGQRGAGYSSLFPVPGNQAVFRYPNRQEATTLWYHDHSLGTTRLTVFAGLEGVYLVRDARDTGAANNPIRLPAGGYEQELVIQDRMFDTDGQWLFPDTGVNPDVHPFWIPEFFGDVSVVNGKSWPYMDVEARRYRFRILNASNARFYRMSLSNGMPFWQIGTDGGFLDAPVPVTQLLLGPAERADVIVDFTAAAGTTVLVTNDAPAPFPGGVAPDPTTVGQVMQFRVGAAPASDPACDPSVSPLLAQGCRLRATPIVRLADPKTGTPAPGVTPYKTRQLVLIEHLSAIGQPLEVLLNNTKWTGLKESTLTSPSPQPIPDSVKIGQEWVTELPRVGSTELWEIANLTDDAHPIHIHLIQFQMLNRQDFYVTDPLDPTKGYKPAYQAMTLPGDGPPQPYATPNADGAVGGNPAFSPFLLNAPLPPEPNRAGWKDTLVMYPGQVTRVLARWAPQSTPVAGVRPGQNLFAFDPTLVDAKSRDFAGNPGGPGYVWHCHILDHEDNEMMRPYAVAR